MILKLVDYYLLSTFDNAILIFNNLRIVTCIKINYLLNYFFLINFKYQNFILNFII